MFKELNIMRLFFERPNHEYNVRDVARSLKISPATASTRLKRLARHGLLKERKERLSKLYRPDLESDLYIDLKRFFITRKIRESGLLDALNDFYMKPAVVIFGSAAYGMDTDNSDVDILVISENTKMMGNLEGFKRKIKREIHLLVVRDVRDLKNKHLINNVLNGTVLQGEIKWI